MQKKACPYYPDRLKGVNRMSFKNPDKLKKEKNIVNKVKYEPWDSTKTTLAKKPKKKSK